MIKYANKKRSDKEFQVGEYVYLRLQSYRQSSVATRSNHKLSRRFYGKYKILEHIGKVAYRLELPPESRIHPVFHVSLLKQCYGNNLSNKGSLEKFGSEIEISSLPKTILDVRLDAHGKTQLLIKWEKKPLEEATWEDKDTLEEMFPSFTNIADNEVSQGEGDYMDQARTTPDPAQQQARPKREINRPTRFQI
ncbi:uncharacterized protein LOC143597915 [Bidens hawaiensis]|uniref:uncharacterized protein LOC143597915 n=1 Tax=Bidens hawaiensis TaxID=980011 RepID=UPI00404A4426